MKGVVIALIVKYLCCVLSTFACVYNFREYMWRENEKRKQISQNNKQMQQQQQTAKDINSSKQEHL